MLSRPNSYADTFVVAEGRKPLLKRLLWADGSRADGIWHPNADPENGQWAKPSDFQAGADSTANQRKFKFHLFECSTFEQRKTLRESLAHKLITYPALITGVLADPLEADLYQITDDHWVTRNEHTRGSRTSPTLVDAPRSFLTIDLDGLRINDDVIEADDELPDIIADVFDRAGLDWLIVDCIMHLSSSHGITDNHAVRMHIDWHLKDPLTLAEQKCIARYINTRAREAGISDQLCDEAVYDPSRLLFTAPPYLYKRIFTPGQGVTEARHKGPPMTRIKTVSRGQARLTDIPAEALHEVRVAQHAAAVRRITHTTARRDEERRPSRMEPGNVYNVIRSRIYAAAINTPAHRAEQEKQRVAEQLHSEICALPDHAQNGMRRLRYLSGTEFERSWQGALERRYPWSITLSRSHQYNAPAHIDAARAALKTGVERLVREGVEFAHAAQDDTAWIKPLPKHTLITVPPGVGKTEAVISAIKHQYLMSERISYLSPSIELSREATSRFRAVAAQDEYTQSRIRHLIGRKHVCKDKAYGAMAAQVEATGQSPLKLVCAYCPRRDACPWPAQQGGMASGFSAGQHAHAITSLAKFKTADADGAPSLTVIDESMLATLISDGRSPSLSLDDLKDRANRGAIKTYSGRVAKHDTADLLAYRSTLITALEQSKGVLKIEDIALFGSDIKDAMAAEGACTRWHRHDMQDALVEFHEATKKRQPTQQLQARIASNSEQIQTSAWFIHAYRAVEGSLSVPGREHVFGVRRSDNVVSVHLLAELPPAIRDRHCIWLDGTANPKVWAETLRQQAGQIETMEMRIDVMPGPYRLTQFADRPYGKRFFSGLSSAQVARRNRLIRYIEWQSLRHKDVLIICQQFLEQHLRDAGLPENVHVEHYNNIRGIDKYRNVACAIIIGRAAPRTNDLEVMTEALHYANPDVSTIESAKEGYHTDEIKIPLAADATNRPVASLQAESHPDPHVRHMRDQIVRAEVQQALMRLRLFDRTPDNPAELVVFGQIETGLVADQLCDWNDARIEPWELVLAGGVISTAPEVVAGMAMGRFSTMKTDALKKLMREARRHTDDGWQDVMETHGGRTVRVWRKIKNG